MPFIVVQITATTKVLKPWFGVTVGENATLRGIYNDFANGMLDSGDCLTQEYNSGVIHASVGASKKDLTPVDFATQISDAVGTLGNFIEFKVQRADDLPAPRRQLSAFDVLMAASKERHHLPKKWNKSNKKFELKNDLIDWLEKNGVGWSASEKDFLGVQFINTLSSVLWDIDGNHYTLSQRGYGVPAELSSFTGYNKPETYKRQRVTPKKMAAQLLIEHSTALLNLTSSAYIKLPDWTGVRAAILRLADNLRKYANYLNQQKVATATNQQRESILLSEREEWKSLPGEPVASIQPALKERYRRIHEMLEKAADFEVICLNEYTPSPSREKYNFLVGLVVPMRCQHYRYRNGNYILEFIWRVPGEIDEATLISKNMKIRDELTKTLPKYHSRAMKREFVQSFGAVTSCKPAFLRRAYQMLTGDSSAGRTMSEEEIDQRVTELVELQDPELVVDLRLNNAGRPLQYTAFLEECKKYIIECVDTAVDDRRHDVVHDGDVVVHMATALSVRDLHAQVTERCPDGTPIPSVQWLSLQFWPRRVNAASSKRYYGTLKIRYMVQARQFRKQHIDMHYASALFRYLKEFAVHFRGHTTMVCMDDKHTMKVGEPGYPVAAVERGKRVLVATGAKFEVGDHDFTRLSLIPSVTLQVEIPETVEGSWYQGKVHVGIKEHTFEPSTARRHAAELHSLMKEDTNAILALYTDGGPDHRVNLLSVQIALISLFLKEDRDMVVAVRTPPYNSWKDPAERVMSVLNCGAQCVGLMRTETPIEDQLQNCSTLKSVRQLAEDHPDLQVKKEVLASVQPCKDLLRCVFERLTFSGTPLSTYAAATDEEIEDLWSEILEIDSTILVSDTTRAKLKKKEDFNEFYHAHCKDRHYLFSVKKCGDEECRFHKPPSLPSDLFEDLHHLPDPVPNGERYEQFAAVYGTDQSGPEKYRPSAPSVPLPGRRDGSGRGHGMPFNPTKHTSSNVKRVIQCEECGKWRVLHSAKKISSEQSNHLGQLLDDVVYSCGSDLTDLKTDENEDIFTVYVRLDLTCRKNIEITYYIPGNDPICFFCGTEDALDVSEDFYPLCTSCKEEGQKKAKKQTRSFKPRNEQP